MTDKTTRWHAVRQQVGGRFGGYAAVGALGTLLHWLIYAGLVVMSVAPVIATSLGAVAGAGVNYWLNLRLVFRTPDNSFRRLLKFLVVAGIGLLINGAAVWLLHDVNVWLAQLCATLLVLFCGYWMNARWTFAPHASR